MGPICALSFQLVRSLARSLARFFLPVRLAGEPRKASSAPPTRPLLISRPPTGRRRISSKLVGLRRRRTSVTESPAAWRLLVCEPALAWSQAKQSERLGREQSQDYWARVASRLAARLVPAGGSQLCGRRLKIATRSLALANKPNESTDFTSVASARAACLHARAARRQVHARSPARPLSMEHVRAGLDKLWRLGQPRLQYFHRKLGGRNLGPLAGLVGRQALNESLIRSGKRRAIYCSPPSRPIRGGRS